MVIVGCVLAYGRTVDKRRSDILEFAVALVLAP
jgi:hypothetical protein